jgi:hypothetical protein
MGRQRKLDRAAVDRIARAVVTGRRGLGKAEDVWADRIAGLMRNRLAAAGCGGDPAPVDRWRVYLTCDGVIVDRLLARAAKHLVAAAVPEHGRAVWGKGFEAERVVAQFRCAARIGTKRS